MYRNVCNEDNIIISRGARKRKENYREETITHETEILSGTRTTLTSYILVACRVLTLLTRYNRIFDAERFTN